MSEMALSNLAQSEVFEAGDEGPVIEVYRRDGEQTRLAKVTERHHCPIRTGEIFVSLASVDREWSDKHDSSHPATDVTVFMEFPDGKRPLDCVQEVSINYNLGFTYCMTCVTDDETGVGLSVFDKTDPVAALTNLDSVQFAIAAGYSLALQLEVDKVAVVHGPARYLDYERRNLELRRARTLQSVGRSNSGVEATFIKEDKPEHRVQNEYRFLFLCDRKGLDSTKVPMIEGLVNEHVDPVEVWTEL